MVVVVTTVAFLIHLYSVASMAGDEGYWRFFAYMNLFVGSMLTLVLADNLLLLYLGWEGVGLCSYLLIGFWYRDPANGKAAIKAFVVTSVGDTSFAIGLFLLFFSSAPCRSRSSCKGRPYHGRQGPLSRWPPPPCSWGGRWENRPSCRSRPGFPTPWPARPR